MPQRQLARRATYIVMGGNVFLLIIKALATRVSESLAILTETVNSLTDVFASIAVLICVRLATTSADESHPFGHARAEPLAGLVVAIFTGIMGWEVLHSPLSRLANPGDQLYIGPYALPVLVVTLLVKGAMTIYLRRLAGRIHSPALKASSYDCRNDVLVASLALIGVILGHQFPVVDAGAALLISVYILYNAYQIGRENVDYLMGTTPEPAMLEEIREKAAGVSLADEIHNIRAHYVGTFLHVELDVLIDGDLSTHDSHHVAELVREQIEQIDYVDRAFVHIEPRRP